MPSVELFAEQDADYRDRVIPPEVGARVSIEAASTFGWHRWVGDRGVTLGIDRFGMSAPAGAIAKELGFTPEHVAAVAAGLLAKA
jgi:transketolase